MRKFRFVVAFAVLGCVAMSQVIATPSASAHDPIFVGDDQTTPDIGPYMPDGSISWALYGQVLDTGDTRGFEFDLRAGDELYISLLIPNKEPELSLATEDLPTVELTAPDGSVQVFEPELRVVFDEPFSNTSYVTLTEHREPAQAGRYQGIVIGAAPARFTIAIGEEEIFFTETERSGDRPSSFLDLAAPLQAWYSTPPGGEPSVDLAEDEGAINLDLVEEAMESGEGTIAGDGSLRGDDADESEVTEEDAAPDVDSDAEESADESVEASAEPASEAVASPPDEEDDTAAATVGDGADEDSGSSTWVAPVIVVGVLLLGAAGWFVSRSRA